jgi:hypothetical protein
MSTVEMVKEIYVRIVGDGTADNPGLDKRVDRLESKQKMVSWVSGTALGGIITAATAWVWSKITHS